MLKVVLADDEVRVCRLVQMLADWDALGMEVVGTASNGLEALALVETLCPHILITDIRMPGCDGLELIEKAKQISPNLEIALISGYAEFEYAQAAINYDVGGYMLKPIKKEILMATLEKLGKKCRERSAAAVLMENLRQSSDKNLDMLRSRLPEDLMQKRLEAPTREQLRDEYGFNVQDGLLQAFILKLDYSPENFHSVSIVVIQKKVEEVFQTSVFSRCLRAMFQFHGSAGCGVINYPAQKHDVIRRLLRECLNQLAAQKFALGFVEFSLAVGKSVESASELPNSMRDAQNAIAERLVEGTGRFLEASLPPSGIDLRKLLDKYGKAIEYATDTLSMEEADRAVEDLHYSVCRFPDVRGYELLDLVLMAGKMFAVRVNIEDEAKLIQSFGENCDLCGCSKALFDYLRRFQRQQLEIMQSRYENRSLKPIRLAKQYMQQHFSEPITLDDVSAAIGFSTSYFSVMFKKETGEGFSKYLSKIRIEQAKILLQETNLPVAEICTKVGYSDLKHFTSTFKKITSLNPGQYRKLHG